MDIEANAAVTSLPIADPPRAARARPTNGSRLFVLGRSTTACASCTLASACLPGDAEDAAALAALMRTRIRVRRGDALYRAGDPFRSLFAVRLGAFKSVAPSEDGRHQVTGFPMQGDLAGFDGIDGARHRATLVALEDSEVCAVDFAELQDAARASASLQRRLVAIIGREFADDLRMRVLLGTMSAPARLAAFLCDLSARYQRLGYSASEFVLRMTRDDIGSYLGLKLETVSRLLSRFRAGGLIGVEQRSIRLADRAGLAAIAAARRAA
jgi:CRP/FNR family transcriptional regulator, anaerobic regulatory protein